MVASAQSRQHFVHGFLEFVEGIDFSRRVEIGIRDDRYKAMVPNPAGDTKQVRLWLPVPSDSQWQTVEDLTVEAPVP